MPAPDHLSASQLITAELCGENYRRRYIEGERGPCSVDRPRGASVHKARHASLKRRLDGLELPPVEEVRDVAADQFKGEWETGDIVIPEGESLKALKGKTLDSVVRLAVCDRMELQPGIWPEALERKSVIEIAGLPPIVAYSDVDDRENVVHELKTGGEGSQFPRGMADASEQITTYCLALAKTKGLERVKAIMEKVRDLKSGTVAGVQETMRGMDHFQALLNRFAALVRAIEKGVFLPASQGHCPRWCEFYGTCPYVAHPITVSMSGKET